MSRLPIRVRLALAAWTTALLVAGIQWSIAPEPVQVAEAKPEKGGATVATDAAKPEKGGATVATDAAKPARRGLELINLQLY